MIAFLHPIIVKAAETVIVVKNRSSGFKLSYSIFSNVYEYVSHDRISVMAPKVAAVNSIATEKLNGSL
jgi:hypothetical protein